MPFEMYGDVILTRDVPEHGLRAGDVGTIVERHPVPGVAEEGYSVEFFDMTGNTVGLAILPIAALRRHGVPLHDRADIAGPQAVLGNVAAEDHVAAHVKGHVLPRVHGNESRHVGSSVDLPDRAEPHGLSAGRLDRTLDLVRGTYCTAGSAPRDEATSSERVTPHSRI